jgi:site-specific DNA-cytosine methylase
MSKTPKFSTTVNDGEKPESPSFLDPGENVSLSSRYMLAKAPRLTHGSLFSGIGGFDLAFGSVGIPTRWQVETDLYCQAVLKKQFPGVPIHADIRNIGAKNVERVDIISGGFPCQPVSQAGKKKGKEDDRFLWPEMLRVVGELKPRWVVAENVRGLLSDDGGRTFEEICSGLETKGYEVLPFLLPACGFGAPHRRNRVWILAHSQSIDLRARDEGEKRRQNWDNSAGEGENVAHRDLQHGKGREVQDACGQAGSGSIGDGWWETEPTVGRVADGVSLRAHRLKCLGNAIVPGIGTWIARQIMRHEARISKVERVGKELNPRLARAAEANAYILSVNANGVNDLTDEKQVPVAPTMYVTMTETERNQTMKTAAGFDEWLQSKRQRPVGICGECAHEKELRQLEPEQLCGACLENLRRAEAKGNDPAAARKDAKKREKKIRSEMNKVLNAVDALDGLVANEHLNDLSIIAKLYLKLIIDGPDGDGHGHDETGRDHDSEPAVDDPQESQNAQTQ